MISSCGSVVRIVGQTSLCDSVLTIWVLDIGYLNGFTRNCDHQVAYSRDEYNVFYQYCLAIICLICNYVPKFITMKP